VTDVARPELTPEVLITTVWDAVKTVPGVVELYRNPLQSLGEKMKLDWHGPVRLLDQQPPAVELHLVVAAGRPIPPIVDQVRTAVRRHLATVAAMPNVAVHVVVEDISEQPEAR
jgi:uncharacterized alkaline shock family protein YloU